MSIEALTLESVLNDSRIFDKSINSDEIINLESFYLNEMYEDVTVFELSITAIDAFTTITAEDGKVKTFFVEFWNKIKMAFSKLVEAIGRFCGWIKEKFQTFFHKEPQPKLTETLANQIVEKAEENPQFAEAIQDLLGYDVKADTNNRNLIKAGFEKLNEAIRAVKQMWTDSSAHDIETYDGKTRHVSKGEDFLGRISAKIRSDFIVTIDKLTDGKGITSQMILDQLGNLQEMMATPKNSAAEWQALAKYIDRTIKWFDDIVKEYVGDPGSLSPEDEAKYKELRNLLNLLYEKSTYSFKGMCKFIKSWCKVCGFTINIKKAIEGGKKIVDKVKNDEDINEDDINNLGVNAR